jgi:LAO/AO transport system kinase
MEKLAANQKAFIRPSPSSGSLGGVTRRTRETIILCEAAGFRNIIIETVGVGQSETMVAAMVDFFLLLMLPGAGDELQGIKRGIIEMADLITINKSDGNNLQKAKLAKREYENALHLFPPSPSGWTPLVTLCSAIENTGVSEVWEVVLDHHQKMTDNGFRKQRRLEQSHHWMEETIRYNLLDSFSQHPGVKRMLPELRRLVTRGTITPYQAARELLSLYGEKD